MEIKDLRELLAYAADNYGKNAAYLYKTKPSDSYKPISFTDFRDHVRMFGAALLDLGLLDKRVAIISESRYEYVVSYLAVANGLGVTVPLDKELPSQEIAALIKRADVGAVIFSDKTSLRVGEACGMLKAEGKDSPLLISMDRTEDEHGTLAMRNLVYRGQRLLSEGSTEYDDLPIDPDEMRIIVFTSGTTGYAKGVMLSHRNLCSNVENVACYVNLDRIGKKKVGLSILPMHHTYEFSADVLGSIYQGGTLAFCDGLKYIGRNLEEAGVTYLIAVPLIYENLYSKIWKKAEKEDKSNRLHRAIKLARAVSLLDDENYRRKDRRSDRAFKDIKKALGGNLRLMVSGAAAIDPNIVADFNAMGFKMVQGYGMTEYAPIIALNPDYEAKPSSAGKALPHTQIRINEPDEDGVGEIWCKGASMMLGYYNNPEETAKIITPDGWLKTGDLGYIDREGYVHISGRKKNLILTSNGKNVFPEEVEYYLLQSKYIEECLVSQKDNVVFAEIYPDYSQFDKDANSQDIEAVIRKEVDAANDKMPSYKRVKRFSLRDTEFEKTTSRKIKRW